MYRRENVFLLVAILVAFVETVGPAVVAVAFAFRWRRERNPRAVGLIGFALGGCLFLLSWIGKQLLLIAGLHDLLVDVSTFPRIVVSCLGAGLLAGLVEESIRFGAGAFLFRSARGLRPLRAAVCFGLGWGGMEAAITGLGALFTVMDGLQNPDAIAPPAWLPLVGLTERVSAIFLHVAFTAFAVLASRSKAGRAVAIFAATAAAHAAIDAGVRALALRGLDGPNALLLEVYFAVCAAAVFAVASSVRAEALSPSA